MLGLIALFTHMHIFWVAGLLLAMIDLPDFGTPLDQIAGSAEKIAGIRFGGGDSEVASSAQGQTGEVADMLSRTSTAGRHNDQAAAPLTASGPTGTAQAEPSHALSSSCALC